MIGWYLLEALLYGVGFLLAVVAVAGLWAFVVEECMPLFSAAISMIPSFYANLGTKSFRPRVGKVEHTNADVLAEVEALKTNNAIRAIRDFNAAHTLNRQQDVYAAFAAAQNQAIAAQYMVQRQMQTLRQQHEERIRRIAARQVGLRPWE